MPTPRLDAERHRPLWISLFLIALDLTTMSRAWGNDMVPEEVASGTMWLYVGTYTHGKTPSEGIYLLEFDLASGRLTTKGFAIAPDLGLDRVFVYKLDVGKGTLTPNEPPFATVAPGSGPRHFAFHPGGRFGYVISEMANTVTAFAYDADRGTLTEIQTISTLPPSFQGKSYTAEVQVHPSGKFVYGSNRGHDSIAIFTVDPATGKLTAAGHQAMLDKNPRNFAIDPTATYLLAENQDSDSIVVFRIDPATGGLEQVGEP
ncbi:MAG: lactonase family protein, partial [Isosphaeraceae bacterium]